MIFVYAVLLIVSILFFVLYKGVISLYILGFAILLPLFLWVINLCLRSSVKARLSLKSKRCTAGQSIPVEIEIENSSIFPVLNAEITLEYTITSSDKPERLKINTPIYPKNVQKLSTLFSSQHCGIANFKISRVRLFDILRISRIRLPEKSISQENAQTAVFPISLELKNEVSDYYDLDLESEKFSPDEPGNDPSQIFDIRQYSDGDKMSKIHWKLTAKQGELMTKEYSLPSADSFLIITDSYVGQGEDASRLFDVCCSLTLSLSQLLLENNASHRIAVFSEKERRLKYQSVNDDYTQNTAAMNLLSCGISKSSRLGVYALEESEQGTKYSHIIFVCAHADEQMLSELTSNALAMRYTAIICGSQPSEQTIYSDTQAQIIYADCNDLANSLEEFTL